MSKRKAILLIRDMLECIGKIERYTAGMDYGFFSTNDLVLDAVVRNLQIIGEAARRIPQPLQRQYADIPWHRVIGFRNVIVHEYFNVDPEILWVIVCRHLPELKSVLSQMYEDLISHYYPRLHPPKTPFSRISTYW